MTVTALSRLVQPSELNFLKSYAEKTGPMWQSFRKESDRLVAEADYDNALAAARQCFSDYGAWMFAAV